MPNTCTDHLSCRLAGTREAEAYTEYAVPGDLPGDLVVKVGTETLGRLHRADGQYARWEATAGGNAVPLSTAGQVEYRQALRELATYALNAAFHMRMALHG